MSSSTIRVDGISVRLTAHALGRYIERVKPALDRPAAIEDLARLARCGQFDGPPWWAHHRLDGPSLAENHEWWLHLGEDVAFALEPAPDDPGVVWAITCVTRTGISDAERAARSFRRRVGPAGHGRQRDPKAERRRPRGEWRNEAWEELAA